MATSSTTISELRLLEDCQRLERLHLEIHGVPSERKSVVITMPKTLTLLTLSVRESDDKTEKAKRDDFKRRLSSLLRVGGRTEQTLRRSMRLGAAL